MKKLTSLLALLLVFTCSVSLCLADTTTASEPDASATSESVETKEADETAESTDTSDAQETTKEETASPMKDIDGSTELGKSIAKLYEAGVVNGIPEADGTFSYKPGNPVTRAEFCKMVNITFGYTISADNKFWDVTPADWYYIHVLPAIHYGYIQGYSDGGFHGTDNITREQVCTILSRIVNKTSDKEVVINDAVSDWAKPYVTNIIALGYMDLEEGGAFRATQPMTRGELAFALDDFVTVKAPEGSTTTPGTTPGTNTEDKKEEENKSPSITIGGGGGGGGRPNNNNNNSGNTSPSTPTETSYKITYSLNGGSLSDKQTTYKKSDTDYTLPTPTKSNNKFMGWFETADADPTSAEAITVLPSGSTGDKTYYAIWAPYYTIKYVLHPAEYAKDEDSELIMGRFDEVAAIKEKYTKYDEDYVLPTPTRNDGEMFLGWYEEQELELNGKNVKVIIKKDDYMVDSITTGEEGNRVLHALWNDMEVSSRSAYSGIDNCLTSVNNIRADDQKPDVEPLFVLVESTGILPILVDAMEDVLQWQQEGILVSSNLVRGIYSNEAQQIKDLYLSQDLTDSDREAIKLELGYISNVQTLATLFDVNLLFGQ